MTITAALAWYDEPPAALRRLVKSLRGLVDRIVAVDGAWELVDGATPHSPPEQRRAIRDAGIQIGAEVYIHERGRIWTGQVEKRDWMMRVAAKNTDWILIVDADYEIVCRNPKAVRRELRHTTADALRINLYTPIPDGDLTDQIFAHEWHAKMAGQLVPHYLLFRALPGLQVEQRHWWYSGLKNGRRVALWGCNGLDYPKARQRRLVSQMTIQHHCLSRPQELIDRNRIYIERRSRVLQETGLEP